MVEIVFEKNRKRAASYDGGINMGECTYSDGGDIWIIDHTYVEPTYTGQGIASKLVAKVVEEARANNKKILPLCPFAKKEFERKEEYNDVLAK